MSRYPILKIDHQYLSTNKEAQIVSTSSLRVFMSVLVKTAQFLFKLQVKPFCSI